MPTEKSEEEMCLPRATVDKLIHDILPKGYSINKMTREILRDSSHLFLEMIALEANRICEVENKKTITNQHVFRALEKYGFPQYIDSCSAASNDYEDYSRHKPSRQNKFRESGKTLDELHEDQMKLFNAARKEVNMEFGLAADMSDEDSE